MNLGEASVHIAFKAARQYCAVHDLTANDESLFACCKSWCKIKLPEALHDAKEALACGMNQAAEQTFALSMAAAGIEAAKEASLPKTINAPQAESEAA